MAFQVALLLEELASLANSSGFFSSSFLLTLAPAPNGKSEFVTLENEDEGENAAIPTNIKANINMRIIMLKANEIAIS